MDCITVGSVNSIGGHYSLMNYRKQGEKNRLILRQKPKYTIRRFNGKTLMIPYERLFTVV